MLTDRIIQLFEETMETHKQAHYDFLAVTLRGGTGFLEETHCQCGLCWTLYLRSHKKRIVGAFRIYTDFDGTFNHYVYPSPHEARRWAQLDRAGRWLEGPCDPPTNNQLPTL
ncbi:MAG: hypothetical protein HN929_14300 [Chloroflexi bacterium]|nr:hypothetical protein [Chloroflexota bacterium]